VAVVAGRWPDVVADVAAELQKLIVEKKVDPYAPQVLESGFPPKDLVRNTVPGVARHARRPFQA
jgi:hypothetical protein